MRTKFRSCLALGFLCVQVRHSLNEALPDVQDRLLHTRACVCEREAVHTTERSTARAYRGAGDAAGEQLEDKQGKVVHHPIGLQGQGPRLSCCWITEKKTCVTIASVSESQTTT
jgi:hypothetical protein